MPNVNKYPDIPRAVFVDPAAVVENVFEDPSGLNDFRSRAIATRYLEERYEDPAPGGEIVVQTGITSRFHPHIIRKTRTSNVRSIEGDPDKRWIPRPSTSVLVSTLGTIGTTLALNAGSIVEDIKDEVKQATHLIDNHFNPPEDTLFSIPNPREVPATYKTVSVELSNNRPGLSNPDEAKLKRFISRFDGKEIRGAIVTGKSSDEYGSDDTIGVAESPDQDFADERSQAAAKVLQGILKSEHPNVNVETRIDQNVVSPKDKEFLQMLTTQYGYNSITDAIHSVENGSESRPRLIQVVDDYFTSKRGTTVTLKTNQMATPGSPDTSVLNVVIPGETTSTRRSRP